MKISFELPVLALCLIFLNSCAKKEIEENVPMASVIENSGGPAEEVKSKINSEIISVNDLDSNGLLKVNPNPDQIRKVIRYNLFGGIEDSILFRYDSQNRLIKLEYGLFRKGQGEHKIEYKYGMNQGGVHTITEKRFEKNSALIYEPNTQASEINYSLDPFGRANSISIVQGQNFTKNYGLAYDGFGQINYSQTSGYKYGDYFLNYSYKALNGNLVEIQADCEVYPEKFKVDIEYYNYPYNHNLFISPYEGSIPLFWNYSLANLLDVRYNFLGRRNKNLIKRVTRTKLGIPSTIILSDIALQYDFNNKGFVSKVKAANVLPNGIIESYQVKYEIFYF